MKHIVLFIALLCTQAAATCAQSNFTKGHAVFEYGFSVEKDKKETVRKLYDSIEYNKLKAFSPNLTDSLFKLSPNCYDSVSLFFNKKLKTVLWLSNDTIFRKDSIASDQIIEQIKAYNHFDGTEIQFIKGLPLFTFDSTNIFAKNKSKQFIFEANKNLRKMILGYDCYKILLTIIDTVKKETQFINLYVTEKIHLPIHILIPSDKMYKQFFPLEIELSDNKIPDLIKTIKAVNINL